MLSARLVRIFFLALALGWMGFLFYLSSRSTIPVEALEAGGGGSLALRKLGHAGAFGVLAMLLRWGIGADRRRLLVYAAAFALTVAYAVGDEVHQRFTPGRSGSLMDVVIDSAGALATLGVWRALEVVVPLRAGRSRPGVAH